MVPPAIDPSVSVWTTVRLSPIDLIVRGICALRPGIPGASDRITVRSVVGRLLEHSRIWFFENGGKPEAYIGSADLMERNLNARVEVICPVLDPGIGESIRQVILEAYLRDNVRATQLGSDGTYEPIERGSDAPFDAQTTLMSRNQRERLARGDEPLETAAPSGT